MSWVKLDDQARQHPKLIAAGPEAVCLWACGLMWCNTQKARDGFIPHVMVKVLYPMPRIEKATAKLVEVGLWEPVEGGFQVHDYHDFQPSAEDAESLSAKRAAAGRAGGRRSGEARRSKMTPATEAVSKQVASFCFEANQAANEPRPDPDPVPIPTESESAHARPRARREVKGTRVPKSCATAAEVQAWAAEHGIDAAHRCFDKFIDHWRSNNELKSDWAAAWRNWLRREEEFKTGGKFVPRGRKADLEQPAASPGYGWRDRGAAGAA